MSVTLRLPQRYRQAHVKNQLCYAALAHSADKSKLTVYQITVQQSSKAARRNFSQSESHL